MHALQALPLLALLLAGAGHPAAPAAAHPARGPSWSWSRRRPTPGWSPWSPGRPNAASADPADAATLVALAVLVVGTLGAGGYALRRRNGARPAGSSPRAEVTALTTDLLFQLTFYLALPFWVLLILAPRWSGRRGCSPRRG